MLPSVRTIRQIAVVFLGLVVPIVAWAFQPFTITGTEHGVQLSSSLEILHDPKTELDVTSAYQLVQEGKFQPLSSMTSTGFMPGAFWGHITFVNPSEKPRTVHLEYVDHQLIFLKAFQSTSVEGKFDSIANLKIYGPFGEREVLHHRFVVPVTVPAGETAEVLVQYGSQGHGYVFPNMRVWEPEALRSQQIEEVGMLSFIIGGLMLMSLVAIIIGFATRDKMFFFYSFYAMAKVAMWWTMVGLTRQFFLTDDFHWQYISISGALVITTGVWFARQFLQTRLHTPRLDYLLIAMLVCACLLLLSAMLELASMSILLITLILLMYPFVTVAGLLRWAQGVTEAAFFALAWSFLVVGLLGQALRDLGYIEHNLVNYYWPAVGSYAEMIVILIAMGMSFTRLRREKDAAERRYLQQLESKKFELETLVSERTRDLELAKSVAEVEARTDPLTGANNRRSFFRQAGKLRDRSQERYTPFSMLMFDIDHFKAINDNFGHNVGDQALCLFSRAIMKEIRDTDVFGRLGGEEFALVLAGSNEQIMHTAERLRQVVGKLPLAVEGRQVSFTTSVGVAHYNGEETIEELLYRADAALYDAKQEGRNRVKLALLAS